MGGQFDEVLFMVDKRSVYLSCRNGAGEQIFLLPGEVDFVNPPEVQNIRFPRLGAIEFTTRNHVGMDGPRTVRLQFTRDQDSRTNYNFLFDFRLAWAQAHCAHLGSIRLDEKKNKFASTETELKQTKAS